MQVAARNPWRLVALALLLPWAIAAGSAAQPAPAKSDARAPEAPGEARADSPTLEQGVLGTILRVSETEIDVRDLSEGSGGSVIFRLPGGSDVAVTGEKDSWKALAKGDLIALSYRSGVPARVLGIRVLPITAHPAVRTAVGENLYDKPGAREYVGWIKYIDAETVVLRTPDGPPGSKRTGGTKTFARQPDTVVELLRDSWDELKKGDRVTITFRKGEPRPAERVKVVLRGGEKPLPPGLATRLFDPAYDARVEDVDGIGEWPAGKPWPGKHATQSGAAAQPAPVR